MVAKPRSERVFCGMNENRETWGKRRNIWWCDVWIIILDVRVEDGSVLFGEMTDWGV